MYSIRSRFITGTLILICFNFSGCYLGTQGYYALKYQLGARPVEKVLADPATSDSIRAFLDLTRKVRTFAVDSLGLRDNRSYTSLVRLDKPYLVNVVCACAPDTFRPFTWRFPVVGSVPYKGYFVRADADREAAALRRKGLDVLVRGAGAYSSLGIIPDPLYSFMARYSLYDISSMLIHEQTHATVYLKNKTDFNEQLAMFIGEEGALRFILSTWGDTSVQFRTALAEKHDNGAYMAQVRALHDSLALIYASTPDRTARLERKGACIRQWRENLLAHRDSLFQTSEYRNGFKKAEVNNAYIMDYMAYVADQSEFDDALGRCHGDLRGMIRGLAVSMANTKDPWEALRHISVTGNNENPSHGEVDHSASE